MTRTLLLSYLGVGLLGGVVGALVIRVGTPTPKAARPALSAEAEPSDTSDLETRIKQLEGSVATLERERKMMKLAAAYGSAVNQAADAGEPPSSVVDNPVFQAAVRDVMDQVETEKRDERKEERAERRRQAAERWTSSMAQTLGLDAGQKQKVAAVVQGFFDDLRALRDSDEGAGSPGEWRKKMQEVRKKRESELSQILTKDQMEKYTALEDNEKLGFGTGGGGRRRGGGGGN